MRFSSGKVGTEVTAELEVVSAWLEKVGSSARGHKEDLDKVPKAYEEKGAIEIWKEGNKNVITIYLFLQIKKVHKIIKILSKLVVLS